MKGLARSQVPPRSDHLKHSQSPQQFWYLRNVDRMDPMTPASRAALTDTGSWPYSGPGHALQTHPPDWHSWLQAPSSLKLQATPTDPGYRLGPSDIDSQPVPEQGWSSWIHQVHSNGPENLAGSQGSRLAPVDPGMRLAPVDQSTRPAHLLTQELDLSTEGVQHQARPWTPLDGTPRQAD